MDFSKLSKQELEIILSVVYNDLKNLNERAEKSASEYAEATKDRSVKYPYQTGYLMSKINSIYEFIDNNSDK